ncbi:hypothetical protein MTO96_049479 [Rhipicephalus appendiculatus]
MIADGTVKAKTMLPGYFRNGTRANLATVVPVGEPTVPIFSESWASRNQRKALSNTAVSETSRIPKGVGTPVPSTRLNSFEVRSGVRSPPTRTQRGDRFTTTASPIVRVGTKHREATVPSDVQSSRDSTGRYAIIPAMTIQSAVTGDRMIPTTKPATSTRETRMPSSARHSALDDSTSTPRKKSSAVPTPSSAAGTTFEVTESRSIAITEKTAAVTNAVTNGVLKDTSSAGDNANITRTGKMEEHQRVLTNVAASARPGSTFSFAKETAVVSDADKKIAEAGSNGDVGFTTYTTAVSVTAASTQNARGSGGMDTTTRNFVHADRSSEAPAVTMASPVSSSEDITYPAWRINSALNANASPITAGGKNPVVDSANAAPSDVKSVTAWRIGTASTLHSVSLTASAVQSP